MKIEVTQEHIDKGKPCWSDECPVALAIKENVQTGVYVDVEPEQIEFAGNRLEKSVVMSTPRAVGTFVRRFDLKRKCKPFSFNLDIPEKYLRTV